MMNRLLTGPLFYQSDKQQQQPKGKSNMTANTNLRMMVGDCSSFEEGLERLEKLAGMSRGRAILTLRRFNGAMYQAWMKKKWATDNGRMQRL
jgi:hypothetical protein